MLGCCGVLVGVGGGGERMFKSCIAAQQPLLLFTRLELTVVYSGVCGSWGGGGGRAKRREWRVGGGGGIYLSFCL